jgi:hypothetical protein
MKARSPVIFALLALLLAGSVILTRAGSVERGTSQTSEARPTLIAGNYCVSCHSAEDPRLENPLAWRGGIAVAAESPCPAMLKINEELYYTERLLLAIDRYKATLPGYVNSASLESRLRSAQQGYQRLLDAPVTSLEAFTAEAQSVRYRLGKVYSGVQALDETAKQTRALVASIGVSLALLVSLIWGLYHTRHVSWASFSRRRGAIISAAAFVLLVFAFFAMPLLRVPAEEVETDPEAQALQTTLDTAQRRAIAADRAQARAWMLGKVAAAWNAFDPAKAQDVLAEALVASEQQRMDAVALWGEAAAAQEAATGDLAKLETAGLIVDRLNSSRSRAWELRLIAEEWAKLDPQRASQVLEAASKVAMQAPGVYRDLDLRGIAVAYASLDPQRARLVAGQIADPALRAWALREIDAQPLASQIANDPETPEAQTLATLQRALAGDRASWQQAWDASLNIADPFERSRAQVEIARGWATSDPAQAVQAAQQIEIPLLRDRALRFVTLITGDASLVSQIENVYDRVMALTALGQYAEAQELADELKETYPLLPLAQALASSDPQRALELVDRLQREVDKAAALRAIALATRDPAIFERALNMALAARVRNDALAPAQASLDLARAFMEIDPALAQRALAQALEIAQRISTK